MEELERKMAEMEEMALKGRTTELALRRGDYSNDIEREHARDGL